MPAAGAAGPASFWALERLSESAIAAAHHYLTDPEVLEEGNLWL